MTEASGVEHPKNHGEVTIVVSGAPVKVNIVGHEQVHHLVREALAVSGSVGQHPNEWELRSETGELFDQQLTIHRAGITVGQTLFLSPRAGVGGSR